jgi:hypothetical protein
MLSGMTEPAYLLDRIAVLEARVRDAVTRRRGGTPHTADPFRGLYLSDEEVDGLLDGPVGVPSPVALDSAPDGTPLGRLRQHFGLLPLDVELLVVALAPDLDPRFERLYGYLHDDVTRRRASVGLALELAGVPATSAPGRARLAPGAPLVDGGLVEVSEPDRPYLTRGLRVPDRVCAHLLGDGTPDPTLAGLLAPPVPCPAGEPKALAATVRRGALLTYLHERRGGGAVPFAAAAFGELGMPVLVLDLTQLGTRDPVAVGAAARREARLLGAGLIAGPVEALGGTDALTAVRVAAFCDPSWPVALYGRRSWDPLWSTQVPLCVEAPEADVSGLWSGLLDGEVEPGLDAVAAVGTASLDPYQVQRAARAAGWQAVYAGRPVGRDELRLGTRAQNAAGLERLARRIEPGVGWTDLVLPPRPTQLLRELATRARTQHLVLDEWGMRQGGGRGSGISALFAGPSGTGKTMAAEVIAYELGFDLYTVDLATVVDKYIGETEKNLDRIFSEAERVNGVLFFDEADALFGKRSDVKDAHDRYANVETAFLLQRMETFDGVAVLATNLRANLDDAFTRRLDALVDFPAPDPEYRRRIWELALRPGLPRAADVDLDLLAERFQLTGGNIRGIALTAAYFAAEQGRPVCMADLMRAVHREFLKLGRLYHAADFTPYESVLA